MKVADYVMNHGLAIDSGSIVMNIARTVVPIGPSSGDHACPVISSTIAYLIDRRTTRIVLVGALREHNLCR